MSHDDAARASLAVRQAVIVDALMTDVPIPKGFNARHVDAARHVVRAKRIRVERRRKRNASLRKRSPAWTSTRRRRVALWRTWWQKFCTRWRTNSDM